MLLLTAHATLLPKECAHAHLDVSCNTDPLTGHSQVPQLLSFTRFGSIAAQISQQGPAGNTIAVQETLTRSAPLLCQVRCEGFWKRCERNFSLVMGVICWCEAIVLCMCSQP